MPEGTIKRLFVKRGFGLIDTGGKRDLFFHFSSLQGLHTADLRIGQRVEYEVVEGAREPRAQSVRPA